MANEQNLIPGGHKFTKEECAEGGRAKSRSRNARSSFKKDILNRLRDGETQQKIVDSIIEECETGNTRMVELMLGIIGEKPKEEHRITVKKSKKMDDIISQLSGEGLEE